MIENRRYNAVFERVAVGAAVQDLFEIVAPTGARVRLISLAITQDSEKADAQAEMLNVLIHRGTTSGSSGTTVTPTGLNHKETFGGTVEANNTTQSTEGTIEWSESFDVMSGLRKFWKKEERIEIPKSGRLVVELQTAPADAITMSGTLTFEELVAVHTKDPS